MKTATIKMYRILESGIKAEYFNIILENVKFTTVAPYLSPNGISSTHLETLELRYEAITWKIRKEILSIVIAGTIVAVRDDKGFHRRSRLPVSLTRTSTAGGKSGG